MCLYICYSVQFRKKINTQVNITMKCNEIKSHMCIGVCMCVGVCKRVECEGAHRLLFRHIASSLRQKIKI